MDIRNIEKKTNFPECSILAKTIHCAIMDDPFLMGIIHLLNKIGDNIILVEFILPIEGKGRHGLIISVQRIEVPFMSHEWMEKEREGRDYDYECDIRTTYIDIKSDGTRGKNLKSHGSWWHSYQHESIEDLISAIGRYASAHKDWSMPYDLYMHKFTRYYAMNSGKNSESDWSGSFNDFYHRFYYGYCQIQTGKFIDQSSDESIKESAEKPPEESIEQSDEESTEESIDKQSDEPIEENVDEYSSEYSDEYSDVCEYNEESDYYSIVFSYSDEESDELDKINML